MVNEPVAWMFEYGTDRGDAVNGISWYPNVHFKKPDLSGLIRNIEPLYTHPAKTPTLVLDGNRVYPTAKILTDEEIWKLWGECPHGLVYGRVMMFADLVLRKASEK